MNITFFFHIICVHINLEERLHKYLRSPMYSCCFGLFMPENYQLQSNFVCWLIEQPRSFICVFVVQQGSDPRTWQQAEFPGRRQNLQVVAWISPGSMCSYACINYMATYLPTGPCICCPKESTISKHGIHLTILQLPTYGDYLFGQDLQENNCIQLHFVAYFSTLYTTFPIGVCM